MLVGARWRPYCVGVRLISQLLVLVAVLLMPFGMSASPAAEHHSAAAETPMGHCSGQAPSPAMKGGIADCTMACAAALPAVDLGPAMLPATVHVAIEPGGAERLEGIHPEIATPPPRHS